MFDLSGRVALVTGAGQGVGAGIARQLASQGASVAINDVDPARAKESAAAVVAGGSRAEAVEFDVSDFDAVVAGVAAVEAALGPIDILVNNAGVPAGMGLSPFRSTSADAWRAYIDINLYGVMNCSKAVVDGMCDRGFGRVITISSAAGQTGLAIGVSAYAAGKGGGIAFMRHLALETAASGVTANTVALGLMDNVPAEAVAGLSTTIPTGRLGSPDDVGACCAYLASDEAAWMTGQTIGLNGGSVTS